MGKYVLNRIIVVCPVLIIVSVIAFSLIHFIPGSPVDYIYAEVPTTTPEMRHALEASLGLDKPLHEQYFSWIGKILRGEFGDSIFYRRPNYDLIAERFPATLALTLVATFLALLVAIPMGVVAAIKRHSVIDYAAMVFSVIGISVPHFWLAILLILAFSLYLPIFPSSGYALSLSEPLETLKHFALPAATLATGMAAIVARMVRSEMLEELSKEYIRTARAKGVSEGTIIFKHALKNALVPVITVIGLRFGALLSGAVIIEYIFAWPGIGGLVIDAIYSRDYPLVQILILLFAVIFIGINLAVDILYKYADPRIKLE